MWRGSCVGKITHFLLLLFTFYFLLNAHSQVRIYTPRGKTHLGAFALNVATRALMFFEKYFGIPYPLPKVDLLGIPDFAAGAMEVC